MPTLSRHAGYFILFQTKMLGSVHIKFRNKSEYFMTHMLNPMLVKLNMYDLSQLWLNSKWILLDRENIRKFPELSSYCSIFFSWINIHEYFSFQAILLQRIYFLMQWLSFFLPESQVPSSFSFVPSRRTTCKLCLKRQ